jgi:hypothetical protein
VLLSADGGRAWMERFCFPYKSSVPWAYKTLCFKDLSSEDRGGIIKQNIHNIELI